MEFNKQTTTTRSSASEAIIDPGLRSYMLTVYNYMGSALLLTGFIATFFISSAINAADLSNYTNANIDWKQFDGETVTVLLSKHPWQEQIEPLIPEFEELTGINVKLKLLPENQYLTKVPADMEAGTFKFDVFICKLLLDDNIIS